MSFRHEHRVPSGTWVVVADRGRARFFTRAAESAPLEEIDALTCPEGASHPHDLVTDKRGYFKGHSGSMQTGDPQTDFKHRAAERFAQSVVQRLEAGRQHQQFGEVVLVASPMFLGELRSHLKEPLAKLVARQISKDYSSLSAVEIANRLNALPEREPDSESTEQDIKDVFGVTCLDDVVVVTLAGDLGEFALERLHTDAERALHLYELEHDKRHVVLDFKNTAFFGSSAMGFFTRLWKRVRAKGGRMVLCHLSPLEQELLQVTQLDTLWPAYGSLNDAIDAVRQTNHAAST